VAVNILSMVPEGDEEEGPASLLLQAAKPAAMAITNRILFIKGYLMLNPNLGGFLFSGAKKNQATRSRLIYGRGQLDSKG